MDVGWTNALEKQVKLLFESKGFQCFPKTDRFNRIRLHMNNEEIPWNVSPEADCAAIHGDTWIFVELDTGEGVSHNVAKYFYYLDTLKQKPERVFLFHVLGPRFLDSRSNYLFHKRLAEFLANKMKHDFKQSFDFMYIQSTPFEKAEEAYTWLKEEINKYFP